MKFILNLLLGLSVFSPVLVFAQVNNLFDAESLVYVLLTKLAYLLWALAIAVFFWGLVKFIKNAADTKEHEEGKQFIIWGLISLLILVSLWAIVALVLVDTLGITSAPVCYIDKNGAQICP